MGTISRTDQILIDANFPGATKCSAEYVTIEIDTSCPHVPFGFVRVTRAELNNGESPDRFLASCIASDQLIEPLTATIEEFPTAGLTGVFEVLYADLARVGKNGVIHLPRANSGVLCP